MSDVHSTGALRQQPEAVDHDRDISALAERVSTADDAQVVLIALERRLNKLRSGAAWAERAHGLVIDAHEACEPLPEVDERLALERDMHDDMVRRSL